MKLYDIYKEDVMRHLKSFLLALVIGSGFTPYGLLWGIITQRMYDAAFQNDIARLKVYMLTFTVYIGAILVNNYYNGHVRNQLITILNKNTNNRFKEKIESLPIRNYEGYKSGEIINIQKNISDITSLFYRLLTLAFSFLSIILASLYVIFFMNWKLYIVMVVLAPVPFIYKKVTRSLQQRSAKIFDQQSDSNNLVQEVIQGMDIVRSYTLEDKISDRYYRVISEIYENKVEKVDLDIKLRLIQSFYTVFISTVFPIIGAYLLIKGEISPGVLIAAGGIFTAIIERVTGIFETYQDYMNIRPAIDKVMEIFQQPSEELKPSQVNQDDSEISIEIDNLFFSYNPGEPVLQNLNARFAKNRVTALVGKSGSGKSTIFKILAGFYPPDQGQLRLYGNPISMVSARDKITLVPQDDIFFPVSIGENIGFGKEVAPTEEEIYRAAQAVNADKFIQKTPEQYGTILHEKGANLSGGQRQLISLARSYIKDAPILLFDEPTASQDPVSKGNIEKAIGKLARDKTVIVIAHSISTVKTADNILVLDQGQIVEEGSYRELMDRKGQFYQLYKRGEL